MLHLIQLPTQCQNGSCFDGMVSAHKVLCCCYAHALNRHVTAHHQSHLLIDVFCPLSDCALQTHLNNGHNLACTVGETIHTVFFLACNLASSLFTALSRYMCPAVACLLLALLHAIVYLLSFLVASNVASTG